MLYEGRLTALPFFKKSSPKAQEDQTKDSQERLGQITCSHPYSSVATIHKLSDESLRYLGISPMPSPRT